VQALKRLADRLREPRGPGDGLTLRLVASTLTASGRDGSSQAARPVPDLDGSQQLVRFIFAECFAECANDFMPRRICRLEQKASRLDRDGG
jgi:hypothetical protein